MNYDKDRDVLRWGPVEVRNWSNPQTKTVGWFFLVVTVLGLGLFLGGILSEQLRFVLGGGMVAIWPWLLIWRFGGHRR